MIWRIRLILVGALVWIVSLVADNESNRIVLDYADTLRSRGNVRELIGNVKVSRGITRITAERAIYDPESGQLKLAGKVRMVEPKRQIKSETVRYDEQSGNFDAAGNVDVLFGDSLRIQCKTAHYNDMSNILFLDGNLIIDVFSDSSRITGEWGQFNMKDSSGYIEGSPVYRLPDKEGENRDTTIIESQRLKFSRQNRSAEFTGDVRLSRKDLLAIADTLFHQPDSNSTFMSGAPVLWHNQDQLIGKQVELLYEGRKIKQMRVLGNAVVYSPVRDGDDRRNKLSGEKLNFIVFDDSSRFIHVEGDAKGRYFVWDERDNYQGVNQATADVINITIVGKKTTLIEILGQASGAFYPPGFEPADFIESDSKSRTTIEKREL